MSDGTNNATANIDDLLDSTLDDLADMPEFKPFPAGAHRAIIKFDYTKVINGIPTVELALTGKETMELSNPEDTPLKDGDSTNVLFMLKKKDGEVNELGQGQLKEVLKPLAAHFGTPSNRATMDAANGAECLIVTVIREDKKNSRFYTGIASLQVL